MRGVAEVMYGRLSEGEAGRRGALDWYLLKVSQMIKMAKNFSKVWMIKVTQSRLENSTKIFREGAPHLGL